MGNLNKDQIKLNNIWSERYAKNIELLLKKYNEDSDEDMRKSHLKCKTCFYLRSGIAGQGFTHCICQNCGKGITHHNTDVPKYCKDCSNKYNACVKCGANI